MDNGILEEIEITITAVLQYYKKIEMKIIIWASYNTWGWKRSLVRAMVQVLPR